jgi:RNA recognition motif-containing protein
VEATITNDRSSGRPSGFAQVEMADEIDAVTALHMLEGHEVGTQRIQVSRLPLVAQRPSTNGGADSRPSSRRRKSKGSRRGVRGRKRRL